MSEFAARAALTRMNLQAIAVAPHHPSLMADLQAIARITPEQAEANFLSSRVDLCAAYGFTATEQRKPFAFANGIAIIPISGTLLNRVSYSYDGYVTGYNFIRRQLNAALADDDVIGILFDVNTYGGEAAGCFELAAEIRASRKQKPSMAIVDSNAYSAGFALASAATKMVAIPSAGVGSIGVITMHMDMSKMLDNYGVNVTLIYEGKHKADGNPYEPLPKEVEGSIRSRIHSKYEAFVTLASENTGLDAKVIRDTESRTYEADEALKLGLIHAVMTPSEAASAFLDELSGSNLNQRQGAKMSTAQTNEPGASNNAAPATVDTAAATAQARQAERARVNGILTCDEAKGRESLANHIAMNTEMSVDDAKKMLAASPKAEAKAETKPNGFEAAMANTPNPNVGADAANADANGAADPVAGIMGAYKAATGRAELKA